MEETEAAEGGRAEMSGEVGKWVSGEKQTGTDRATGTARGATGGYRGQLVQDGEGGMEGARMR